MIGVTVKTSSEELNPSDGRRTARTRRSAKSSRRAALAVALFSWPACATGEVTTVDYDPTPDADDEHERGTLLCEAVDGRIHCLDGASLWPGKRRILRLRATRQDVERTGPLVFGYDVCAVSKGDGFHCVNTRARRRTSNRIRASYAEPLESRSWFSWDQGLCVESQRGDETSLFECFYREAGVRQRVDFKVSQSHRTVSFESGACVCSEPQWFDAGKGETPVGVACFFRDDDIPRYTDYNNRTADSLTRGVIMRGPIFTTDFGEVCNQLENTSSERAVQLIEAWASGEVALPPHRGD